MMKIYHYCAFVQNLKNNSIQFCDGVVCTEEIKIFKGDYLSLKDRIGKMMEPEQKGCNITVFSLSVIGECE